MIKKDGWQCWVEIYGDYVIKKIKSKKEISKKIKKYLDWIGKPEELEKRTKKMLEDIKGSTKIIKESNIPKKLLANAKFLKNNLVKQKKAVVLEEALNKIDESEAKKLIDKSIEFLIEIWKYGVHEKTFKFLSNFGVIKGKIVLIDIFELTNKKKKVEKQIKEEKWNKPKRLKGKIPDRLADYFMKKCKGKLTLENLNKNWGIKNAEQKNNKRNKT